VQKLGTNERFSHSTFTRQAQVFNPTRSRKSLKAASFGFWRPATRSSWIPPVPETAGRQILYRALESGFQGSEKATGAPRGARLASSPRHAIEPLSFDLGAQLSAASARGKCEEVKAESVPTAAETQQRYH
jgi:hypothetical protein